MKVIIERDNSTQESNATSVAQLLKELGLNSEEVLITKNNKLVSIQEELSEEDEVKILSVISGG